MEKSNQEAVRVELEAAVMGDGCGFFWFSPKGGECYDLVFFFAEGDGRRWLWN